MKNKVTFDYSYPPLTPEIKKLEIDGKIVKEIAHIFWGLYHEGYVTDFHLVDEDMTPLTGEKDDDEL